MGAEVTWLAADGPMDGVLEQPFHLDLSGIVVPGVLWLPVGRETPAPLVLLGHGGSGHKRNARNLELGRRFASDTEIAALAIDGPYHGDRVASPLGAAEYQALIRAEGLEVVVDRMVREWQAVVDVFGDLEAVDATALGYVGLSMGTRFGVPFAAAVGDALRCAVFGKFGLTQAPGMYEGMDMTTRLTNDARAISAASLFHVQWDDEVFPRDGQFALFDSLGTPDKQLVAFPGAHAETSSVATEHWCSFVVGHLKPT